MTDGTPAKLSAPSKARKLLVAAVFWLLIPIAGEAVVRGRAWFKYGSANAVMDDMTTSDPASGLVVLRPGFAVTGRNTSIKINSLGFRGDEIARKKPPNTIRIACMGASTTFSADVSNNHKTWPHQLQEALQTEYPDVKIEVINAGVPGYVIADSAVALKQRVLPLEPDIVILAAHNDIVYDTREEAVRRGFIAPTENNLWPVTKWLSRQSMLFDLVYKNSRLLLGHDGGPVRKLASVPIDMPTRYMRRVAEIDDTLRQRRIPLVLSTFVAKYRRDQSRETQLANAGMAFYYMPWMTIEALLDEVDDYNGALLQYAAAHNVPVVDDRTMIPADPQHFVDWIHLTDEGSALMAKRFQRGLDEHSLVRSAIDRLRGLS